MKIRVANDFEGDELVKALAATALAYGVTRPLAETLAKSTKNPFDTLDWQKRLQDLSAESTWANPAVQKVEDALVRTAESSTLEWVSLLFPTIRWLLKRPVPARFSAFDEQSARRIIPVSRLVHSLDAVPSIAKRQVEKMKRMPPKGDWVDAPNPPTRKPFKAPSQSEIQRNAEWIARTSAGTKMRDWAEGMREDVRWQVVQAIRAGIRADAMEERLRERWEAQRRHLRTIAATELSMAYNDATLVLLADQHAVIPPIGDEKVCASCKHWLEGKVFYVSPMPIENPTKQEWEQYLWPGKSNIGREQKDWGPCVPLHPNCRHEVVLYRGGSPKDYRN